MLNTAEVYSGAKKFTPVSAFTLSMVLLGALVNKFPPEQEIVVLGKDFSCGQIPRRNLSAAVTRFNNYSSDAVLPSFGLAVVSLALPLMPLVIPVVSLGVLHQESHRAGGETVQDAGRFENPSLSAKTELNKIALRFALQLLVGQASCFGSTELARHFIVSPDLTFFEKCKLQRNTCRTLESLDLLVYRVGGNETASEVPLLCANSQVPDSELRESLHSVPNTASALAGSSLVMFVLAMWMRRRIIDYVSREESEVAKREPLILRTGQRNAGETEGERTTKKAGKKEKRNAAIERLLRESNPYFKIVLLLLSLCLLTVLLIDRYRQNRNTSYEIAGSLVCGAIVQCLVNVFYEAKKIQVL